jgi:hypothetical protein
MSRATNHGEPGEQAAAPSGRPRSGRGADRTLFGYRSGPHVTGTPGKVSPSVAGGAVPQGLDGQ